MQLKKKKEKKEKPIKIQTRSNTVNQHDWPSVVQQMKGEKYRKVAFSDENMIEMEWHDDFQHYFRDLRKEPTIQKFELLLATWKRTPNFAQAKMEAKRT